MEIFFGRLLNMEEIEEKLRLAQKLIAEAKEIASDNGLLFHYKVHEFAEMDIEDATQDINYWHSSSFCSNGGDSTYY